MLNQVVSIAKEASVFFHKEIEIHDKEGTGNYVTTADIQVEKFLKEQLSNLLPDSGFIGEEGDIINPNQPYVWVVDPIDGTTNFIYQLNLRNNELNLLVVDERSEITTFSEDLNGVDVYKNCTKTFAFNNGIRSMKPDVIITDEINLDTDIETIENAITSGVKVVATIHASSINDLKNKKAFTNIINKQLFDRYVVLGFSNGVGTIEGVYNQSFRCLYL